MGAFTLSQLRQRRELIPATDADGTASPHSATRRAISSAPILFRSRRRTTLPISLSFATSFSPHSPSPLC